MELIATYDYSLHSGPVNLEDPVSGLVRGGAVTQDTGDAVVLLVRDTSLQLLVDRVTEF